MKLTAVWMLTLLLMLTLRAMSCDRAGDDRVRGAPSIGDGLPYYSTPDLTPAWPAPEIADAPSFHRIRAFRFVDQDGRAVTESTIAGKVSVVNFFFASCGGICPRMTENLTRVQKTFAEDDEVILLSHSVTPEIDTVSALSVYAEAKGVRSGKWRLLTGDRREIYDVARTSYFADAGAEYDRGPNDFLHTEKVFLVDEERRIRGVYNGVRTMDIRRLIEDVQELRKES